LLAVDLNAAMNSRLTQQLLWSILAVALIIIGGFSFLSWTHSNSKKLDDFGPVPQFSLIDEHGQTITLNAFKGHVWVADLIFTHCTSICPMLTSKMFALQQALKDQPDVKLASFSVDPTHDRPDTLLRYSAMHHADTKQWSFLTGAVPTIYTVAKMGFHLPLDSVGGEQTTPIIHSPRFVIIDQHGHMRGYYNGAEDASRKQILSDIELLKNEGQE
jgi:protein SCO1